MPWARPHIKAAHVSHVAVLQLEMHFSTYASLMIKGLSQSYEWENIQLLPEHVES